MTLDLAQQAERRARVAALCGWLLLAEPGPDVAELVVGVPALRRLADPTLAVEYERIFLRAVPPYESVFRAVDRADASSLVVAVSETYAELGFTEHTEQRWRIAAPDHLGLELRCYGHLCAAEAAAWASDRPDEAASAVQAERAFLAARLVPWAETAIDALVPAAARTPYAELLDAAGELLHGEIERLRPCPLLPGAVPSATPPPTRLGPARLARYLLSAARCGFWLDVTSIGDAAARLGFPWRPVDNRGRIRQLVEAAEEAGELALLVQPWRELAEHAAATAAERRRTQPGAEAHWADVEQLARSTVSLLDAVGHSGSLDHDDDREVTLRVAGRDAGRALEILRAAGLDADLS